MPEVTMLLGAALGIFLLFAIILTAFAHRRRRDDRSGHGAYGSDGGAGWSGSGKSGPDSGSWTGGGDSGGGDGGGGGGGD